MAQYKQRCIVCKKNYVLMTRGQRPICMTCDMADINEEITEPKWKKFFNIDKKFYEQNNFLRSIKKNYLRQGDLTMKQKQMFIKVAKEIKAK